MKVELNEDRFKEKKKNHAAKRLNKIMHLKPIQINTNICLMFYSLQNTIHKETSISITL